MTRFSAPPHPLLGRRALLRAMVAGAGIAAVPGLAACGSEGGAAATDTVSFGNNASDQVPKDAITAALKAFEGESGLKVAINTKQHEQYQEQINNYLQGKPDDVLAWFAGYRMRFFAEKGLTGDLSEVWSKVSGGYEPALKEASTATDGKQYLIPFTQYPWGVFYRKSVWQQRGYEVPKTLDELVSLSTRMKSDGLVPIAFAQKQGWPGMGTFDQLNFRINGYRFHVDLMAGKEHWQSPKVREVFDTWKRLLPLHQENALGREWQEAAQALQQGKAGMYLLGSFIAQQFKGEEEDLDFFPYPEINPEHGQDTVEAPIDGYMMARKPANPEGAKKLLEYLSAPAAQLLYTKADSGVIATSNKADTSGYNSLQKKAAQVIKEAAHITQFLDRDTDPRFASDAATNGLNAFIQNPDDLDSILKGMADQAKTIFTG
ncbi:carbohydrate ABC transporter substrate-binding protein (CUT1 family) [Saccharothrix carnea]|uniref:Carbohydrate ABC transporter substrate-binding protein (CUT1 family) n=1 Tax=Saccharothrix carnea TaxID=1280637 RepID=A0A2P8I6R1_SACCR|nr:ABC transporter substrate-binding protein [Saccharothrix carnea]PSL54140.1 carbohydrate ABC transporter substrate-binding protein (CUT1 family) [Saccharothrix carnea]